MSNNRKGLRIFAVVLLSTTFLLGGCTKQIFRMTAGITERFAEDYMLPYMMTTTDLRMSCAMAESMTPIMMTMKQFNPGLEKVTIMSMISASLCSQEVAFEKELEYQRALYTRNNTDAQDARIAMKRHYKTTAERQYAAYQRMVKFYGEPGGKECPRLLDDVEQMNYLVGLLSGLQAIYSDTQATSGLVPRNIAAKVERAAACLDAEKWFGVPLAIRATIWTLLPGALPEGEDNWARLDEADQMGEQSKVRLAHVFHALAAHSKGDKDRVRAIIKKHAEITKNVASEREFRQLDAMATSQLTALSDLMWTEAKGHRTPVGKFGKFWDERAKATNAIDLDDIL